jgi:hypothetical protein
MLLSASLTFQIAGVLGVPEAQPAARQQTASQALDFVMA